jgi:vesicle transport through interaction with t-SNAREs protein 1
MSSSASISFRRYDEEFKSLTHQIQENLGDDGQFHDEERVGDEDTSNLLSQCDELLQQMALEARSVPEPAIKRELLAQVRGYKTELQTLKDDHNKQSLMGNRSNNNHSSSQHRERLLQQQGMLEHQNSQLDNARRVIQETEQVALEITQELGHNRATIESAHGRVRQVTGLTGRARRVVQSMNQRATHQKMLLYGLAASIIVVFLVFVKWLR